MDRIKLGVCISSSFSGLNNKEQEAAKIELEKYFDVSLYLPNTKADAFGSLSLNKRIESINRAAKENEVLLSYSGGFNQIELLLNFNKLRFRKDNIFVGQSDNTLLVNALPALSICKSLYGKGFYNIAKNPDLAKDMVEELYKSVVKLKSLRLDKNPIIIGGNNYTFDVLQGTKFCPSFKNPYILFMEGEDILKESSEVWIDFIRNIDSIMLQAGALKNLKGLVIGKFPDSVKITKKQLDKFINGRPYMKGLPIITDYPCGHNKGSSKYLPIGQNISLKMLNLNDKRKN